MCFSLVVVPFPHVLVHVDQLPQGTGQTQAPETKLLSSRSNFLLIYMKGLRGKLDKRQIRNFAQTYINV